MTPHATLLSALRIGPVTLANRVVSTSHQTTLVHDHLPTEDFVAYHAARAAGGVGAIFLEATAVHPTGLLTPHTLGGYLPGIVAGYERVAAAARPHGTKLLVQLFHGGREQFGGAPRPPAVAPSAVPSPRFHSEPRALTRTEIGEIVAGYAAAAANARRGGLDGVEVSMAHGYLAAQFFSPRTNLRGDEYGGDLDARLRFAVEILEAIRADVGRGIAVGMRLSANEMAPDAAGRDECAAIAERLRATGLVDFVSMALGHSASYRGSTYIAPPPPIPEDAIAPELRRRPRDARRARGRDRRPVRSGRPRARPRRNVAALRALGAPGPRALAPDAAARHGRRRGDDGGLRPIHPGHRRRPL
jgi:2,4-dienoyl-CoA reductase-like NADH-dependent reductase (Old Yellow Enzyme family)